MDIAEERKLNDEIRELRKEKELLECYKRLMINPDFIKVFKDHYLNSYAVSLVHSKADTTASEEFKESLEYKLNSIATFARFLSKLQVDSDSIDMRLAEAELQRNH